MQVLGGWVVWAHVYHVIIIKGTFSLLICYNFNKNMFEQLSIEHVITRLESKV